jgi:hypothetical protein
VVIVEDEAQRLELMAQDIDRFQRTGSNVAAILSPLPAQANRTVAEPRGLTQ